MFFFLSKFLNFLIAPFIWILALILLSLLSSKARIKQYSLGSALVLLLFFSNDFVFQGFARAWELDGVEDRHMKKYDVAILLGGMSDYIPDLNRVQFYEGADRFLQTISLYKKGYIKKIIFTGGSGSLAHPERREGVYLKSYFIMCGIPEEDILVESWSKNTHQNALFTKHIVDSCHIEGKFLLVTSAFHMRRSLGCFKKAGFTDIDPYSTAFMASPKCELNYDRLLPLVLVLDSWTILIHEVIGFITYKIVGYS